MGAVINCKNNTITCEVADEKVIFEFSMTLRELMVEKIWRVNLVDSETENFERVHALRDDSWYETLQGEEGDGERNEVLEIEDQREQVQPEAQEAVDEPPLIQETPKEERSKPPPRVEMKPLLPSLKYAFMESGYGYPFIVNANLNDTSLEKLIVLLKKYKGVIGYSIDDLKGISPSMCMHRIHLEDGHTTSIEPQTRLNPTLKEVVKKEILKLREAGIIYAILDSQWVSPVHVVPKKGGMTIVKDDKGNDISTRTVTG